MCGMIFKKNSYTAIAFLIYLAVAVILLLMPIGFNINRILISSASGDPAFYLWALKWWPYALSHGLNPFITHEIWSPVGQNLAWTGFIPSLAIPFAPFTMLFGPIFAYNIITILSVVASAQLAFLLNKEITNRIWPSIIGGLLFGFSSYVFGQLMAHLTLFVTFAVPALTYLYVLRFKEKINRKKFIILNIILFVFQFGVSNEIFATFILFSFLTILISIFVFRDDLVVNKNLMCLKEIAIAFIFIIIILSPYLYYMLFYEHSYIKGAINDPQVYSADLLNYIIPTPVTLLGGNFFASIASKFSGGNFSEEGAYLGLPLLGVILLFIKEFRKEKIGKLLSITFLVLIICSFGPRLSILQHILPIPTLWFPFSHMPLLDKALPVRYTLYVSLAASIIASYWLSFSSIKPILKYLSVALSIIFIIPNTFGLTGNAFGGSFHIPSFFTSDAYKHYINKDENVLILPFGSHGSSMLYQALSGFYFKMPDGYAGVAPHLFTSIGIWPHSFANYSDIINPKFIKFLELTNPTKIIVTDDFENWEKALAGFYDLKSQRVAGVDIYHINNINKKVVEHKICEQQIHNIDLFRDVAKKYYETYKNFDGFYPLNLERLGLLDQSFGGYPKDAPNFNWTKNGWWLGKWGNFYGIGYSPADTGLVKLLKERYSQDLEMIFFPYPKEFTDKKLDTEPGQVLMIFKLQ